MLRSQSIINGETDEPGTAQGFGIALQLFPVSEPPGTTVNNQHGWCCAFDFRQVRVEQPAVAMPEPTKSRRLKIEASTLILICRNLGHSEKVISVSSDKVSGWRQCPNNFRRKSSKAVDRQKLRDASILFRDDPVASGTETAHQKYVLKSPQYPEAWCWPAISGTIRARTPPDCVAARCDREFHTRLTCDIDQPERQGSEFWKQLSGSG
jgi:hypothetical protein